MTEKKGRLVGLVKDMEDKKLLGFMFQCHCGDGRYIPLNVKVRHHCKKCKVDINILVEGDGIKHKPSVDYEVAYQ